MSSIVVLIEHKDGKISGASLSALTAARLVAAQKNPAQLIGLVVGKDSSETAKLLAPFGFSKAFYNTLDSYVAAPYANLVAAVGAASGAETYIGAASSLGKDLLPAVAAKVDAAMVSDILTVVSSDTYTRGMYAGNVIAEVKISHPIQVISVRPTAFQPATPTSEASDFTTEEIKLHVGPAKAHVKSFQGSGGERPDLGDAKIVVSGGRGVQSKEGFAQYIFPLADALGAAVGASRAAVDAGFAPNDWQVGQTGRSVAPSLYIGIGVSGAIQHIAGMKDSKTIVAINKDPEAPIFEVADYGLVGDLTKLVPELIAEIKKG